MGDTATIAMPSGHEALIDLEDVDSVSTYRWHAIPLRDTTYSATSIAGKRIYLHRLVMKAPKGMEVHHINHNGLDNRKSNLVIVTHQQNLFHQKLSRKNTSGYRGVCKVRRDGYWKAQIKHNQLVFHLGTFQTKEEAAAAWNRKALELFGDTIEFNDVPNWRTTCAG